MRNSALLHIFGEVLFDHFPDGNCVLGGAPFNVAWHLQSFGQSPRLLSRIGADLEGQEIVQRMKSRGMHLDGLQTDPSYPTGSVQVAVDHGEPHYEIVSDCAYDFIDPKLVAEQTSQGILYHGSLAIRNPISQAALQIVKAKHQGKTFVDVNLRAPWWTSDTLLPLLGDADWIKLNESELISLCPCHADLETAMLACFTQFNLETLFVTRGAGGALIYDREYQLISVEPAATTAVVDTVGAGDAFSAVLLLGLVSQWPLPTTLERAQAFASALVGRRGATVVDKNFYKAFADAWALS